jgi:ribonuclease R
MSRSPSSSPPTREMVLEFLERHPDMGSKRDIARELDIGTEHKAELRRILQELEAEGALVRTGKRAFQPAETPPPTGVVLFERIDGDGELIGRVSGREGVYGPDIYYAGPLGRSRNVAVGVGDKALCRIDQLPDGSWRARAIKKLDAEPASTQIGVYRANKYGGVVEPTSRKEKHDFIIERPDSRGAVDGDLVRIMQKAGRGYGPRRAAVVEVLGRSDDPRAASIIAMHAHGVPDEFPEVVVQEARSAKPLKVAREDLTDIPLITIDPEDARDHDDAVWAEPHGKGWRVIVAIADVSAFVRHGTHLDREAYRRGNSTYFPDRVSPMLPEHLSADLCSLKEGVLRETLAVEITFGADGRKTGHRFTRGRMRSAAKLSYREAQDAIDGAPNDKTRPLLPNILEPLWAAWRCVDKARQQREPLELDLPERRVRIGEDGKIKSITLRERFDAHRLIEEFMIQANVCAAQTLDEHRMPQIYRVHEEPSEQKIAALSNFLPTLGLKWGGKTGDASNASFNRLLEQVKGHENAHAIHEMVLRSQAQARYFNENLGHFGLNLREYAHFTSPIRRYSDLIIHRALIRALDLGPDGLSNEELARLEEIAEHVTMTERRSMAAERDATDRYLAHFMAEHVGASFQGRIAGVTKAGLFIKLTDTGADGFCPAARLSDEYWIFDEPHAALVGQRTGKRYDMGMPVEVRLLEATPLTGGLLFSMLTPPRAARRDLKPPRMDAGAAGPRGRRSGGGGRPASRRSSAGGDDGSRPKGQASYGKNRKKKR